MATSATLTSAQAAPVVQTSDPGINTLLSLAHEMRETGRFEAAAGCYSQILRLRPDNFPAAIGLMRTHFYREDWASAWPALDLRFRLMESPPAVTVRDSSGNTVAKPRWTGGPAPKSLLVLDEQGMGDTIQFIRLLPRLIAGGTKVTFVTHRRLFALIRSLGVEMDLRPMDQPGQVSGIESWAPLLSLPGAMGLKTDDFRMVRPYLAAEPERIEKWRAWLGKRDFTVGISWRGNPKAPVDAGRSATLAALGPLAAIPGVRLISLQKDADHGQLKSVPFGQAIEMPGPDFDSGSDAFLDTAALMMSLDLVVTVDTAVAHLAAALGRPVIVALQAWDADWRWIPGREDTIWYPSMRLIRQETRRDWWSAFRKIGEDVRALARKSATGAAAPLTPVSVGELLDKISILEIKKARLPDSEKRNNVIRELDALEAVRRDVVAEDDRITTLCAEMRTVNEALWDIEDLIRVKESEKDFGERFVELARSVYITNDRRAAIKSEINTLCGSALREEKSYAQ